MLDTAAANHGLISTVALRQLGFDRQAIRVLVDDRVLQRVIRGLYRVPGSRSAIQDIAAAITRHGGAVASHRSALWLHELVESPVRRPEITLPRGRGTGGSTLAVVHRSDLLAGDVSEVDGIPVTAPARSIVDAARFLGHRELGDLIHAATRSGGVTIDCIVEAACRVEHEPGRIGHRRLRAVLSQWIGGIDPESPAEAAVIRRISAAGLPVPATQVEIMDRSGAFVARVDLAWCRERVIREYDSDRWHGPHRSVDDELRRQRLEELGWTVGVITRLDLRPSTTRWLRVLARDLRSDHSLAS